MIKPTRQRANRYGFVINNPFITSDVNVVDRDNLDEEQKELMGMVSHDFSFLRKEEFEGLVEFAVLDYYRDKEHTWTGW